MKHLRKYGNAPFHITVIHGGPGAAGEMAPVAHKLSSGQGVLEPLQTATSVQGQVEELKTVLEKNGNLPVILAGFSWGAWLSFIFAAGYPEFVKKLILIGSGPFEEKYAAKIQETRLNRLGEQDNLKVRSAIETLNNPLAENKNALFAQFGALFSKADAYDPVDNPGFGKTDFNLEIYTTVWKDAVEMRKSGKLLELGKRVRCPVVAIHGDYDPHPAEGVRKPLSEILENFRFILLRYCGHKPWIERHAKDRFYHILKQELL
ncbi:MAG: alpha/beta hydrolase [Desulfobacterales bacterium]|nr:alpha/beta hydrolase [Desulfobacterales bacterium]